MKEAISTFLRLARRSLITGDGDNLQSYLFKAIRNLDLDFPIAFDIDGTIDQAPEFFSILSNIWPGKVYIITYREHRAKAITELESIGIRFDDLVIVNSMEEKGQVLVDNNIRVYIDDMDEVITNIPESVVVLKMRNGGNYKAGKWLYSGKTGTKVC